MYAIETRYLGPTDHLGARIVVQFGLHRKVYPYPHEAVDPFESVAARYFDEWARERPGYLDGYRLVGAVLNGGNHVHVMVEEQ